MSSVDVLKHLKALLSGTSDIASIDELLQEVDAKVLDLSAVDDPAGVTDEFLEELQNVYHEDVHYADIQQLTIFVDVLHHLQPVLSSASLISTWFDLVLRPALRDPSLSLAVIEHAKDLVLNALEKAEDSPEKVGEFRRRVLDLYLLDALNEGSSDDVLEWAELDEGQREMRVWWKANLKDTLVRFALRRPKELLTGLYHCFISPTTRLQILNLLDSFVSNESFISMAPELILHPLLRSLLTSLQLDNSTTVCTLGITILLKLLPIMAIKTYDHLKAILPNLLVILARLICWKARDRSGPLGAVSYADLTDHTDTLLVSRLEQAEKDNTQDESSRMDPLIREDLAWQRLEHSFDRTASSVPSPKQYFAFLYYLFPCNTIAFLRRPASYLEGLQAESPFAIDWEEALDEAQIKTESETLLRNHITHPAIIWRDAQAELKLTDPWSSHDVPRIVAECTMLDINHAATASRESTESATFESADGGVGDQSQTPGPSELRHVQYRRRMLLQGMIAASVALKSGADLDVVDLAPDWPSKLLVPPTGTPGIPRGPLPLVDESSDGLSFHGDPMIPEHVTGILSGLQKEVLLLRNELNLELWLKRENVRHVGRLYQDRLVSKSAELERQGLHNKLREYKAQLQQMQKLTKHHQEQAVDMKRKYAEWNAQLQSKLNDLRDQKKTWLTEAIGLRSAHVEAKSHLEAQRQLLAKAQNSVFLLETEIKENAPKVQRLRDYEKRIEQLTAMHRMWNEDVRLHNEQCREVAGIKSEYQNMKLQLESYEKTHAKMLETDRRNRSRITALEEQLRASHPARESAGLKLEDVLAARSAENKVLGEKMAKTRAHNDELHEEVDNLKAMIEEFQAQVTGKMGLVKVKV